MIKTKCFKCGTIKYKSPSKVCEKNFCSRQCYSSIRDKEFAERGKKTRFNGTESFVKVFPKGTKHHLWKGEKVSYRGIHYWVIRNKGYPNKCTQCGKFSLNHRQIQWANIDHKYRRNLDDFIALCVSCHKYHDQKL